MNPYQLSPQTPHPSSTPRTIIKRLILTATPSITNEHRSTPFLLTPLLPVSSSTPLSNYLDNPTQLTPHISFNFDDVSPSESPTSHSDLQTEIDQLKEHSSSLTLRCQQLESEIVQLKHLLERERQQTPPKKNARRRVRFDLPSEENIQPQAPSKRPCQTARARLQQHRPDVKTPSVSPSPIPTIPSIDEFMIVGLLTP